MLRTKVDILGGTSLSPATNITAYYVIIHVGTVGLPFCLCHAISRGTRKATRNITFRDSLDYLTESIFKAVYSYSFCQDQYPVLQPLGIKRHEKPEPFISINKSWLIGENMGNLICNLCLIGVSWETSVSSCVFFGFIDINTLCLLSLISDLCVSISSHVYIADFTCCISKSSSIEICYSNKSHTQWGRNVYASFVPLPKQRAPDLLP